MKSFSTTSPQTELSGTDAVIAAGASLSAAIPLRGQSVIALELGGFTGDAVSFQVSYDGTAYKDLYSPDGEYTVAVAPNVVVTIPAGDLLGFELLKVRAGTQATPSVQADGATVRVISRAL